MQAPTYGTNKIGSLFVHRFPGDGETRQANVGAVQGGHDRGFVPQLAQFREQFLSLRIVVA